VTAGPAPCYRHVHIFFDTKGRAMSSKSTRTETDTFGPIEVEAD
jgi:hypothetical protein